MDKSPRLLVILLIFQISFSTYSQSLLLTADRLFDGTSMHVDYGVLISGNRIQEVGPAQKLIAKADSIVKLPGCTLMPGMIEGHSHVLLYPYNQKSWNDQVLTESRSLRAIRGARNAEWELRAGFTTIRDLGTEGAGYADVGIKQAIEMGITPGPRMIVAGRAIVATGSYGPKGFQPDMEVPLGAEAADGNDLIRVVRDQIGKGADVIKVYADYGWGPGHTAMPTFSLEELKLIVETANTSGRDVVAHASTNEGIRRAVLAGVSTIEHGTDASDEVLELMKEKGVALCPTLAATYAISTYNGWDPETSPEPEAVLKKRESFKRALKHGVKLVAGGDVGVFEHGENVRELELMAAYGMSNLQVLQLVTRDNAINLKLPDLGQLRVGFLADVIAVKGDPSQQIRDLYQVELVMKDGVIYQQ